MKVVEIKYKDFVFNYKNGRFMNPWSSKHCRTSNYSKGTLLEDLLYMG
jgi:hypothetical protein